MLFANINNDGYRLLTTWLFSQLGSKCLLPKHIVCQHPLKVEPYNQLLCTFPHTRVSIHCYNLFWLYVHGCWLLWWLDPRCQWFPLLFHCLKQEFPHPLLTLLSPFHFSLFLFYFHLGTLIVESSIKSFIAISCQLDDRLFLRLFGGVKNYSYFSSLVAPSQMLASLGYSSRSFLTFFPFFFLTSQSLVGPCNLT